MPIATPEAYRQMLENAKTGSYAFPAINCVGSEAINAALKGFADAVNAVGAASGGGGGAGVGRARVVATIGVGGRLIARSPARLGRDHRGRDMKES